MKTEKIYHVTTEGDVEGRHVRTVGYATGNPADIKAYFEDKKYYEIKVQEVTLRHITPQSVQGRKQLLEERLSLKNRLGELEQRLGA